MRYWYTWEDLEAHGTIKPLNLPGPDRRECCFFEGNLKQIFRQHDEVAEFSNVGRTALYEDQERTILVRSLNWK